MRIVLAIVNEADQEPVIKELTNHGYLSTVLSTTGEFMKYGDCTFMVGAQNEQIDHIVSIIKTMTVNYLHQTKEGEPTKSFIYIVDIDQYLNDRIRLQAMEE
ncbi:MAG: cyclic-di-AMP receptor [Erysipelotrichaceae bacterium]